MERVGRSTNTRFAVAVHVLTYLAGRADAVPVNSDELAGSTNTNPVYVRRVLGPLREAGLVASRAGARGGWELAIDPRRISLARVWRILQRSDPVLGLHGPAPSCVVGRGVQESLVVLDLAVAAAMEAELAHYSVHDVLAGRLRPAEEPATGLEPAGATTPASRISSDPSPVAKSPLT